MSVDIVGRSSSSSSPSPRRRALGPPRVASRIPWIRAASAGLRSSSFLTSVLLTATTSGWLAKSGLMEWKRSDCCLIVYPHCSEASTMYRTTARRCAMAVMLCISIVLRSSRGRSKMPGVSRTCHRRYL